MDAVDSAYDVETLKEFANIIGHGIDGAYGDSRPSKASVEQVWKRFLAAFRRKHGQIPRDTALTVWNVRDPGTAPLRSPVISITFPYQKS
jgi:hypothetical protein